MNNNNNSDIVSADDFYLSYDVGSGKRFREAL